MSLLSLLRRARPTAVLASVAATASLAVTVAAAPAYAVVAPKAPAVLPAGIEAMPSYQPQTFCDPIPKAGVTAFGALLTSTYPDTSVIDIARTCGTDTSEHYDGRALDWAVDYKNPQQVKEAQAVFAWLFAPDAAGNNDAMLRRLGVMYIIWNKRIWGSWSRSWQPYACSGVTACHQNHVHFSFDWAGARKRTSFWTGVVAAPMAPPTYVYTSTAFAQVQSVGARQAAVKPPFWVRAGVSYRFTVRGTYHYAAVATGRPSLADAECSSADGRTWTALAPGDVRSSTGLLDLWVSGHRAWRPAVATGGGCNVSTHTYTRTLTFGTTGPLRLAIDDPARSDDSGSLTVTIQRV